MMSGAYRDHLTRRRYRRRGRHAALTAIAVWVHLQHFLTTEAYRIGSFLEQGPVGRRLLLEGGFENAAAEMGSSKLRTEQQEWLSHFRHRRLQQTGIVAISPSGAPLLRRANRSVAAGEEPGGAGEVQLYEVPDQTSFSQRFHTQAPGSSAPVTPPLVPVAGPEEGACHMLAYAGGYASFTAAPYQTYRFTSTKADCCELCDEDADCTAWTRIAGGDASTRSCYLMNSTAVGSASAAGPSPPWPSMAPLPASRPLLAEEAAGLVPSPADGNTLPAGALAAASSSLEIIPKESPLIVESGTKTGKELPAAAYGCPYPPSASGDCVPPVLCNCFDGVCYGSCQGGELLDGLQSLAG